jgi:hypothetical protein
MLAISSPETTLFSTTLSLSSPCLRYMQRITDADYVSGTVPIHFTSSSWDTDSFGGGNSEGSLSALSTDCLLN